VNIKARYGLALLTLLAYYQEWGKVQAALMLGYALLVLTDDFKNLRLNRFDISTAYAALLVLTSVSHLIALFGWSNNPWFFRNSYSPELSAKAIFIFNIGSIFLMESMRRIIKTKDERDTSLLQKISFATVFIVSVTVFIISIYFKGFILSVGSFGSFFLTLLNGSILLLSFIAHYYRRNQLLVLLYTVFLSIWNLQYGYLRMEIVIPLIAYLGGDLLANRSLLKLHTYSKVLIVLALIIFPPLFTYLGENRSKLWGSQKLEVAIDALGEPVDEEGQTIMSRLSMIPQVSQIIMLTEKKGFYNGKTLSYLGYVFIPRFFWPEKPLIIQGQWFALEIGAAYKMKNGKANNSVNMTVPGEFYLNYGWLGVILGCAIFGLFIGWVWNQTDYQTILGWGFRFYLIFLGLFSLGADLQIVPTLIAYWLVYKVVMFLFKNMYSTPNAVNSYPSPIK
jgi:hypothetical protein